MTFSLPRTFTRSILCVTVAIHALNLLTPNTAHAQNANSQQNECATISEILKPTSKTLPGAYTEEAEKNNVEGTVVLCLTVDRRGKVTDVRPLSGPSQLFQSSMDAAKKWEFEPPKKAPALTKAEMTYSMTKACPEGKGNDVGDIVVTIVPAEHEKDGDLKIIGNVSRPVPPYPEAARTQRIRGQLYVGMVVNPDGSVTDVRMTKSLDELLDKSAVETVRTWRFKVSPGGRPTRFSVTLSFRIPCLDR
jgi:TonB family protein